MSNYMYEHTVKERGYVEIPRDKMTDCERDKFYFVLDHLDVTLWNAKCGWENVEYKVMETPSGHRTEFLVLWAEEVGNSGSRWINVTGNSLGAIMCEMCNNLW